MTDKLIQAAEAVLDAHARNTLYSGASHWEELRAALAEARKDAAKTDVDTWMSDPSKQAVPDDATLDAKLADLGWQRINCPACGCDGAWAAPQPPVSEPAEQQGEQAVAKLRRTEFGSGNNRKSAMHFDGFEKVRQHIEQGEKDCRTCVNYGKCACGARFPTCINFSQYKRADYTPLCEVTK